MYNVLKKYYGYDSFRNGQEDIIKNILDRKDVLAIMPTGGGKSVCYQVPAVLLDGITLVISPLISLMKDQVSTLNQIGIRAAYFNSSLTPNQMRLAMQNAKNGLYKIIYVAPERLFTSVFMEFAKATPISMVAVDEAHCISQWGHDFRPSYTKIKDFIKELPERPIVAAFTATATENVKKDIIKNLKLKEPYCLTTGFDRENLYFAIKTPRDKTSFVLDYIKANPEKSGIIYCLTRKLVDSLCEELRSNGFLATKYHAGLKDYERKKNQELFIYDRARVMVATNAFGMGIDKPNVSFVIHYNMPSSIENYYQEAGRAGRDGEPADCIMLYAKSDYKMCEFLLKKSAEQSEETNPFKRLLAEKRDKDNLNKMLLYSTTTGCLRNKLLEHFGERKYEKCNNCENCVLKLEKNRVLSLKKVLSTENCGKVENPNLELLKNLKELRKRISLIQGVPEYTIFSDFVLREISEKVPKTLAQLSSITGFGMYKVEKYGSQILSVTKNF